jgi:hypothetical protein
MILNKLAEAMREHKWTTIVIELLIVVVGIFIGLQVDGWNEDRKDRIEEQVILTRLAAEISIAIADVQRDIGELQGRIDDADYAIAMLAQGTPPADNDARFARGLIGAAYIELPFSGMATIRELQNTGKIMLVLDGDVRAAISRLEFDFADLVAAREFRFALSNLASFLSDNKSWMEQHLLSLEALQKALAAATKGA